MEKVASSSTSGYYCDLRDMLLQNEKKKKEKKKNKKKKRKKETKELAKRGEGTEKSIAIPRITYLT